MQFFTGEFMVILYEKQTRFYSARIMISAVKKKRCHVGLVSGVQHG